MIRSVASWFLFSYLLGVFFIYMQFTAFDVNRLLYLLAGNYGYNFFLNSICASDYLTECVKGTK